MLAILDLFQIETFCQTPCHRHHVVKRKQSLCCEVPGPVIEKISSIRTACITLRSTQTFRIRLSWRLATARLWLRDDIGSGCAVVVFDLKEKGQLRVLVKETNVGTYDIGAICVRIDHAGTVDGHAEVL